MFDQKQNKIKLLGFCQDLRGKSALTYAWEGYQRVHCLRNLAISIKIVNVQTLHKVIAQLGNHPTNMFLKHFNGPKLVTTYVHHFGGVG